MHVRLPFSEPIRRIRHALVHCGPKGSSDEYKNKWLCYYARLERDQIFRPFSVYSPLDV